MNFSLAIILIYNIFKPTETLKITKEGILRRTIKIGF